MKQTLSLAVSILLTLSRFSCQTEDNCDSVNRKCFRVTALVPARAGSKGIKDKNLSLLGNETLIGRTLRIINECGKFDSVWVSTDGENIAQIAIKHGARVHWRNSKTATDEATTLSAVEDFLASHGDSHFVAVVQCTSPFIQSDFLCKALDYVKRNDVDCLFSVTRSHALRWIENKDGFLSPLNFDPKSRPRRQNWAGELVENGMFYFSKVQLILEMKTFQNHRCGFLEIPKNYSLEIDTEEDLNLARTILKRSKRT